MIGLAENGSEGLMRARSHGKHTARRTTAAATRSKASAKPGAIAPTKAAKAQPGGAK